MDRKRLLRVTAGNLRQNHLYIREHIDFFPLEAVGPAKRSGNGHAGIELILDGLGLEARKGEAGSTFKCDT